jgi:Flp pilus assembly protein TadB
MMKTTGNPGRRSSSRYSKQKQRGAVSIIVAASIVLLIGVIGLAVDAGMGYMVKAKLDAATDAAAIAAGEAVTAMLRVADEIHVKSQVLSDEFSLVLLELRAGSSREKALRNLAMRTGVADVETLVAMLVQADRFGTSVGAALRVYTDMLRTKRRHLAEERAAKVALKLLFPLMFFIFPALLIVLLGPAVIQICRVMLPAASGIGG